MIGVTIAFVLSLAGIAAYLVSCYRWDRRAEFVIIDLRAESVVAAAEQITREAAQS